MTPAVKSGFSSSTLGGALWTVGVNTLVVVWFCGDAVVFLLVLETVASGLVFLSGGRLDEVGDDEEEVGVVSLLEFDLMM